MDQKTMVANKADPRLALCNAARALPGVTAAFLYGRNAPEGFAWTIHADERDRAEVLRQKIAGSVRHRILEQDRAVVACSPDGATVLYVHITPPLSDATAAGLDALGRLAASVLFQDAGLEPPAAVNVDPDDTTSLLEHVVDTYPFGAIVVYDQDLRYRWAGGQDLARVGLDAEKMLNRTMFEVFPEVQSIIEPTYRAALRGEVITEEVSYLDQWYLTLNGPVQGRDGRVIAGLTVTQNITELRNVRDALTKSQALVDLAQTIGGVGSWSADLIEGTVTWSSACARLHGYTLEQAPTDLQGFIEAFPSDQRGFLADWLARANAEDERRFQKEVRIEVDGETRWLQVSSHLFDNEEGAPATLVGLSTDITEARRLAIERERNAAALLTAKERAEAGDRAKSQFLATMSHEMRTPLHGILGSASLLDEKHLDAEARECMHTIQASGEALLSLIDDVLDLSRMEHNHLQLEIAPFSLARVLENACHIVTPRSSEKGLRLVRFLNPEVKPWRRGDEGRVRQILLNLLGNAVKFTERGEVRVDVHPDPGRADAIVISVRDTGPGIPPDALARLFQPFSQVDASIQRRYGGSGLGLSIVQRLAEAMDGHAWVESTLGQGSTFSVQLRLPRAEAMGATAPRPSTRPCDASNALRILVAEDHPINQTVISHMLQRLGHDVTLVGNGRAAVDAVQAERFDVVLMDMQMPEMDGLTATRAIRAWEAAERRPRATIWALTANALQDDKQACLDAGHDAFMTKPLRLEVLRAQLSALPSPPPVTEANDATLPLPLSQMR